MLPSEDNRWHDSGARELSSTLNLLFDLSLLQRFHYGALTTIRPDDVNVFCWVRVRGRWGREGGRVVSLMGFLRFLRFHLCMRACGILTPNERRIITSHHVNNEHTTQTLYCRWTPSHGWISLQCPLLIRPWVLAHQRASLLLCVCVCVSRAGCRSVCACVSTGFKSVYVCVHI